jgi:tubulin monoglycylase TTLL3/8
MYNCKFDIRQWFLVTDWNPLTVWFYKESYLRICSQEFNYDSMHEYAGFGTIARHTLSHSSHSCRAVHLSNVAVQQNYLNGHRDSRLPDNNFMTSSEFQEYLKLVLTNFHLVKVNFAVYSDVGAGEKWDEIIYPRMKDAVVNTLLATQDIAESKKVCGLCHDSC